MSQISSFHPFQTTHPPKYPKSWWVEEQTFLHIDWSTSWENGLENRF